MNHRTYGETRNCKGCRYWSEMIAQAIGGGPVEAMCLNQDAPSKGKMRPGWFHECTAWEEGSLGAVDDPGGNPYEEVA